MTLGGSAKSETFSFTMRTLLRWTLCRKPLWVGFALSNARRTSSSLGGSRESVGALGRFEFDGRALAAGLVGAGGSGARSYDSEGDAAEGLAGDDGGWL